MQLVGYDMAQEAARQVYEKSGIDPEDIPVVELHDCFTTNELITYEALGLTPEGTAEKFILEGDNTYGGRVVTNPSGGLLSKGHPLGATGPGTVRRADVAAAGSGRRPPGRRGPHRAAAQHRSGRRRRRHPLREGRLMGVDRDAALALTFPRYERVVERGELQAFAAAIGETDPVYLDPQAAMCRRASGPPGAADVLLQSRAVAPRPFGYLDDLGIDIGSSCTAASSSPTTTSPTPGTGWSSRAGWSTCSRRPPVR